MDTIKYIFGVLFLIVCLALIGAIVWYCMFELPDKTAAEQGTLVLRTLAGEALI